MEFLVPRVVDAELATCKCNCLFFLCDATTVKRTITRKVLNKCVFGYKLKSQPILLFSLFLLLFISLTTLFGTIHESYCTISSNF